MEATVPIVRHLCCLEQVFNHSRSKTFIEGFIHDLEMEVKTSDQKQVFCRGLANFPVMTTCLRRAELCNDLIPTITSKTSIQQQIDTTYRIAKIINDHLIHHGSIQTQSWTSAATMVVIHL